jgi:hypothetical protein
VCVMYWKWSVRFSMYNYHSLKVIGQCW